MEIDICHVLWIQIEVIDFSVLLIFKFKQYKNAILPTFCITRKLVVQEAQGSHVLRNAIFQFKIPVHFQPRILVDTPLPPQLEFE